MKAETNVIDGIMTVTIEGEINTLTAPSLGEAVADLTGISQLIFDLDLVPYVSSAGLRLFLSCQRTLNASGGDMVIKNCNSFMYEIFEGVGYDRIMKVERKD